MRFLKAKTANRTRFAGRRALPWLDIAAVAALLAWICALVYIQQSHQTFVGTDEIIHYFPAAQKVLEGQGYQAFEADVYRGPGYPLALAVVTRLLHGDMFAAGKVIAVTSSTLFLLFAYLLLRRVFNSITALAAVLLIMGVNVFAWVSCCNGTDIPFACLAMASLYFTARHERPTRLNAIVAGLLAGVALTVRWSGLLLPLFFLVRMGLVPGRDGLRSKIQIMVVYLLGFLVASGPWLHVNYLLHGSPLYTEGAIALDPNILPPSESLLDSLLQTLRREPLAFGLRFMAKLFGSLPLVIQGFKSYPVKGGWVMADAFWVLIPVGILFLLMRIDRLKLWFLLVSGIWWASLVPIHFESRYYILLIPTLSVLAVFVVTSGALPDLRLTLGQDKWVKVTPGNILDRLVGSRLPGWLTMNRSGTSLVSLVWIGLLAATAFLTLKDVQRGYRWESEQNGFYHEVAQFVHQLQGPGVHRPIGTRQWSQARYWIPRESGTPVAPFQPGQDYESVLPELSYVLYDQIDDEDTLVDWWDDPKLSALADPLRAPANLEAVYYKPDPYRAILYRVLEHSNPAGIVSASASSALPQNPAVQAFDEDAQTWWSSALHSSEKASESITFDLGSPMPINRVWLLPRQGGQAFPAGLRIDVSQDGKTWQSVIEAEELPEPIQQNPQIFSFSEATARLVRITATTLRWDEDEEAYLASLVEARISLAVESPSELPVFSIVSTDVFFDPLNDELIATVHNQSRAFGQATVEFSEGWSAQGAEYLATVESSIAGPGELGVARLSFSEGDSLQPGDCRPIWATLKSLSYVDLDLDTYGVVRPQPQRVYNLVCSPQEAVIDDFDYPESPLAQGWTVPPDQTATGEVTTTHDQELDRQVMRISSEAEDGFVISRWMRVYGRPKLMLWIKSASEFIIYVQVRDPDGEYYYLQYMPFAWPNYSEEFPEGRYLYYPLGSYLADGRWHRVERDVYEDFLAKTGMEVDYIEALSIRASDNLELADLRLDVRK